MDIKTIKKGGRSRRKVKGEEIMGLKEQIKKRHCW